MPTQALIFDLDGTLLDTLEDLTHATNHALAVLGHGPVPPEDCRKMIGNGVRVLLERALGGNGADLQKALDAFLTYYDEHKCDHTGPFPGVPETLNTLAERGQRFSILSNKPHPATVQMVGQLLADWRFEVVYGQREGVPLKPDPVAALDIAQKMDVQPDRIVFIGDSGEDMATAKSAEMFAVGVSWGLREVSELQAHGADVIVNTPADLLDVLP